MLRGASSNTEEALADRQYPACVQLSPNYRKRLEFLKLKSLYKRLDLELEVKFKITEGEPRPRPKLFKTKNKTWNSRPRPRSQSVNQAKAKTIFLVSRLFQDQTTVSRPRMVTDGGWPMRVNLMFILFVTTSASNSSVRSVVAVRCCVDIAARQRLSVRYTYVVSSDQ